MKKITKLILLLLLSYPGDTKTITCTSAVQPGKANSTKSCPVSGLDEMLETNKWILATRFKI